MPFKKGTSGNVNGRPKGSVNKNKALIENFIDIQIDKNLVKFNEKLLELFNQKIKQYGTN